MRPRSILKRLLVLALPFYVSAGSFGSVLALQACRHMAAHHASHGDPVGTCWCDEMTGGGLTLQSVNEALPPVVSVNAPPIADDDATMNDAIAMPDSPSFGPTPPPPNQRPS
ncbi:MAG TPA: hypothetical protein VJ816_07170 [Gemmatimonadales bacterium]|nr:hypothetical protein [Gemmatimonadales bacterium]